jgi:thioredoxin reductase (NADPH)
MIKKTIEKEKYDVIVIGGGPAGLTSSIYLKRALLKILIFEKNHIFGGKLNKTGEVENYTGFLKINGPNLAKKMSKHASSYEVEKKNEEIVYIKKENNIFVLGTDKNNIFHTKSVIIASGAVENRLGVKGEKEFNNLGVSYCAICDGFIFRDKKIAVVGGGYSSFETSLYMSNIAKKVFLIHRSDNFRIDKEILERAKKVSNIQILVNSSVKEIIGKKSVEKIIIEKEGRKTTLTVDAIFPCVGLSPFSNFSRDLGICDKQNYISVNEDCSTSKKGVFAAGDVARFSDKKIKQIVTAVSEGAIAAQSVIRFLESEKN